MSAYLQELCCYSGTITVYDEAHELIKKMLAVEVTAKQIERVTKYVGEQIDKQESKAIEDAAPVGRLGTEGHRTYVMMDGSMVLTREEKWCEMKLGRLYSEDAKLELSKGRRWIRHSQYVSHLGGHHRFLEKMDHYVHEQKNRVFITDGARWICDWVKATYPEDIHILDFFHASEHLHDFAKVAITDEKKRRQWCAQQTKKLLHDGVQRVIGALKTVPCATATMKESQRLIVGYFTNNSGSMMYGSYQAQGLQIGSGAMESSHRTVIQKRMKLSGQRWSRRGAEYVAQLRCCYLSDQWSQVVSTISTAFL